MAGQIWKKTGSDYTMSSVSRPCPGRTNISVEDSCSEYLEVASGVLLLLWIFLEYNRDSFLERLPADYDVWRAITPHLWRYLKISPLLGVMSIVVTPPERPGPISS